MSDGQSYFEDKYGMSHEDWKFHCKGKDTMISDQYLHSDEDTCPHIVRVEDIDLCSLHNMTVCLLEINNAQEPCTDWEGIKEELRREGWKEKDNADILDNSL